MTTRPFADGLYWRKARRSASQGGNCVFVTMDDTLTGIRDSKQGDNGPQLWITADEWSGFTRRLRRV